ncbi:MAG TPA: glycosyltransferase [Leeuwenhoekiella sp.]|nr:glycosyltransferase [Leeuwenhoekiella sp.]
MWPVIFYIFTGFVLINCCFYAYLSRFCLSKTPNKSNEKHAQRPLSILVCARNEASNLAENIPVLLQQQYPNFEILLINDASTDATAAIIDDFAAQNFHVRAIHIKNTERPINGKKYALRKGIEAARYNHLLFIDADCRPISHFWAQEMAQGFGAKKQIVLGYGSYQHLDQSWLNKIIRYETALTAIQYFGYAKHGNAYMGVGRNLGYTKSLFNAHNGFSAHATIPSGDDDLFVNTSATVTNVSCVYSPQAFTVSRPKTTWSDWFWQKSRHTSVAHLYKTKHQLSLGLFYSSQLFTYIFAVFLLFSTVFSTFSLFIFLVRYLFVGCILYAGMRKLKEKDLIYWFPALEFFLVLSQLSIFITTITPTTISWKNNRT